MKHLAQTIVVIVICLSYSYGQQWQWISTSGPAHSLIGQDISVDQNGNSYIVGEYADGTLFNQITNLFEWTTSGYLAKYDISGNVIWSIDIRSYGWDNSVEVIDCDKFGNCVIAGYKGSGAGTFQKFLKKYDSNGRMLWSKNLDIGKTKSISIDEFSGDILVTGTFVGTATFGTDTLTSQSRSIPSGSNSFLARIDSLGNYIWTVPFYSPGNVITKDIGTDSLGNVFVLGSFSDSMTIDTTTLSVLAGQYVRDIFYSKFTPSGNFEWIKQINGNNNGILVEKAIDVDPIGNCYVMGKFSINLQLDTITLSNSSQYFADAFLIKTLSDGNISWAKKMGKIDLNINDKSGDIVVDNLGNSYIIDKHKGGSIIFSDTTLTGTSTYNNTCFVKYNTDGQVEWAKLAAEGYVSSSSIAIDTLGNCYTAGDIFGSTVFADNFQLPNLVSDNVFVAKLAQQCQISSFFTYTDIGNGNISFIDSSITGIASITSWLWDFGDGNTSTQQNPTHNYSLNNIYQVILTITTNNGCINHFSQSVTSCNTISEFNYINNGNGNYSFTNTSLGNYNQSHWAFGDGNISTATNSNHTFSANGAQVIVLTINDSLTSCFDYFLDTITVTGVTNPLLCNSGFVIYPDTTTGNIILVNNATGTNLTYLWDFGDGNTSTLQHPSHTYATAGPFYLCLTINNGNGCTDMYCDSIGKNGVIFNKAGGFNINVISPNTTGINNNIDLNSEVSIYPNPTSNQLTIDTKLKISNINITDITGKTIKTITSDLNVINVANLSDGIYFIKLITNERTITKKFVKQ